MMVGSKFEKRCYQFFDFTTLDSSMMFSYRNRMKALIRNILTLNHHKYKKFLQKQPSRGAPRERYSESIQPIYGRTPHGIFAAGGAYMPTQEKNLRENTHAEMWFQYICFATHTSVWVYSCKSGAYFQNTFSYEHLWRAVSGLSSNFIMESD